MAFTFHDTATGKSVYDIACPDLIARDTSGNVTTIVQNGGLFIPDWMFPFGYNAKQAVLGLTPISSAAPTDLPGVIAAVAELKAAHNALLAALKTA